MKASKTNVHFFIFQQDRESALLDFLDFIFRDSKNQAYLFSTCLLGSIRIQPASSEVGAGEELPFAAGREDKGLAHGPAPALLRCRRQARDELRERDPNGFSF